FAHYLKPMLRGLIGAGMSASEVEKELQSWANQYVLENPEGCDEAEKAARPFRQVNIRVKNCPGLPGHLDAVVTLVPHYRVSSFIATLVISAPEEDDAKG